MDSPTTSLALVAASTAGLFTGSALYISAVQHPALLDCATSNTSRVALFKSMLARAAPLQATLTLASGVTAVSTGMLQRRDGDPNASATIWLASGVAMIGIVPYTLATIIPINKKLTEDVFVAKPTDMMLTESLVRWGKLHGVRTGVSLVAFCGMLVALSGTVASMKS